MDGLNQKTEMKRLLIYLALAFALAWTVFFAFILTGHRWDGSNPNLESFTALGMLAPLFAHILTRMITKEGFAMTGRDSMMMGISFKNKKWVFFLFAMIVPWIYFEIGHALIFLIYPESFDADGNKKSGFYRRHYLGIMARAAYLCRSQFWYRLSGISLSGYCNYVYQLYLFRHCPYLSYSKIRFHLAGGHYACGK